MQKFPAISQIPIMVVMLNNRNPGIFNEMIFCVLWANVWEFIQQVAGTIIL